MIRDAELVTKAVVGKVVSTLIATESKKATAYLSPRLTVKAIRVAFDGRIDHRDRRADIRLTIGKPNAKERRFIRDAQRAGEPFPIKDVLVRRFPVKAKARKRKH